MIASLDKLLDEFLQGSSMEQIRRDNPLRPQREIEDALRRRLSSLERGLQSIKRKSTDLRSVSKAKRTLRQRLGMGS